MTELPPDAALARPESDETASGERRRRARVIAVAVVVPFVLVAAAVAAFRGGSEGTPKKLPVAAARETAFAQAAGASGAIAPYGGVTYVAGPDLPALDGKAHAYKVSGTVDAALAEKVARAFGLEGKAEQDSDLGFAVTDGSRRLFVYTGRPNSLCTSSCTSSSAFSYDGAGHPPVAPLVCSPAPPNGEAIAGEPATTKPDPADSTANTDSGAGLCAPPPIPPHPAGFPTEEQARDTALAALRAAGVAVDGARIDSHDDGFRWQVTVTPVVDGMATEGMYAGASVNEAGITAAYGALGTPEQVDEYPLIGTAKAIENLNDGTAFAIPYAAGDVSSSGSAVPADGEAVLAVPQTAVPQPAEPPSTLSADAPTCTTLVNPDGTSGETCSGSGSVGSAGEPGYACPAIGAVPPDTVPPCPPPPTTVPGPPPERQVVTLTDAKLGLTLVPSGNGDAYLLPTYVFSTADGPGPTALAIDSSWLEPAPPPVTVEPASSAIEPQTVPPSPPTTCGPPVESAPPDSQAGTAAAVRPADDIGCPIN